MIKDNFDHEINKFNTSSITIKITGKNKHIPQVIDFFFLNGPSKKRVHAWYPGIRSLVNEQFPNRKMVEQI